MDRVGNQVCDLGAGIISAVLFNPPPRLYQINVSDGGVPKLPVGHARITRQGVEGDRQGNAVIHGGESRAVCLYSLEVIEALQAEGHFIAPGSSGENLTLAGIDWPSLTPGEHLSVGEVLLEVTGYTTPCLHNARWFQAGDYSRISHKKHPGWSRVYARVLAEGIVRTGDPVNVDKRVSDRPSAIDCDEMK